MPPGKARSSTVLFKINELVFKERDILDLGRVIQVPSVKYVIERVYTIKKGMEKQARCQDHALREVGFELQELWIFLNRQPKCHSQIVIDVKKLIGETEKLKRYPVSKQAGDTFKHSFAGFEITLQNGFDIKTFDTNRIEELENKYFVSMTEDSEEERMYRDNCVPLTEDKPLVKKGSCPRLMWSTPEVDEDWLVKAMERLKMIQEGEMSAAKKEIALAKEAEERAKEFNLEP